MWNPYLYSSTSHSFSLLDPLFTATHFPPLSISLSPPCFLSPFSRKESILLSSTARTSPRLHIMTSDNVSSPLNGDDYIGTESCIDLQNDNDGDHCDTTSKSNVVKPMSSSNKKKEKREFPPPIPLLARTENLASHMPWVLKRYYTSEGRLILKEERVRHHEYFRAHRANGRLTLQLVTLHHDDDDDEFLGTSEVEAATSPREEISGDIIDQSITITNSFIDEEDKTSIVADDGFDPMENGKGVVGGSNGDGPPKCLNCNVGRSTAPSCIFRVPVHPIRTVHG